MALDSLMRFFNVDDDEDDDDYEIEERTVRNDEVSSRRRQQVKDPSPVMDDDDSTRRGGFLNSKSKVVSMERSVMQINILSPESFEDSGNICKKFLAGRPVVVNLEGIDTDVAQRIMDFISGCVFAKDGTIQQISKHIFIFAPKNVGIDNDAISVDGDAVFMPTLEKEF